MTSTTWPASSASARHRANGSCHSANTSDRRPRIASLLSVESRLVLPIRHPSRHPRASSRSVMASKYARSRANGGWAPSSSVSATMPRTPSK
jgi:hypothetical protein